MMAPLFLAAVQKAWISCERARLWVGIVDMKCTGGFHEFLSTIIAVLEKESVMSLTSVSSSTRV